jgi:hypothetical protein
MSVYYFDLTSTRINENTTRLALNMNKFWLPDDSIQNAAYNTLINYVVFNTPDSYTSDGEYSFGQIYIQPKYDPAQRGSGYPPTIIVDQKKNYGINIDSAWDANGGSYIYIREERPTGSKYAMKCTVI